MEHDIFYFQEQLLAGLREYLPADAGYVYRMETVEKNRETRHALVIGKKTDSIIPTIYMEGIFRRMRTGIPYPASAGISARTSSQGSRPGWIWGRCRTMSR